MKSYLVAPNMHTCDDFTFVVHANSSDEAAKLYREFMADEEWLDSIDVSLRINELVPPGPNARLVDWSEMLAL